MKELQQEDQGRQQQQPPQQQQIEQNRMQQNQQQKQQTQLFNGLTEEQVTRHAERQERLGLTSEEVINDIHAESGAKVSADANCEASEIYSERSPDSTGNDTGALHPAQNQNFQKFKRQ